MESKYFKALFEQSLASELLIDTDFTIIAASDEFLKATKSERKNITGKNLFDAFPDNPDDKSSHGESIIRASLNKVIATKVTDTLTVTKYDIPKPASPDEFDAKYWKPVHSPILDESNNVKYIVQRVVDVTESESLSTQLETEKKALQRIDESNKRFYMLLMKSPFAFSVMKGKDKVITLANDLMKEFWGKGKEVEGKTLHQLLPELDDQPFPTLIDNVYLTGIPHYANEISAQLEYNGKMEDRYFNIVYQPHYEADTTISGVTTIAYDVTEMVLARKKIEESEYRYRMLIEEATVATALYTGREIRVQYANDMMLSFWGKSNKIIGKPLRDVVPELKGQPFFEYFESVFTSGKSYIGVEEKAALLVDGKLRLFYFNFTYKALRDKEGKIYGIHHMAIDVTDQVLAKKAFEVSEAFNRTVLESSPDCLKILDLEGKLQFMNYNGLCIMEIEDFSTFKNKYWWELWGVENQQMVKDVVAKALNGETGYFQALNPTTKGNPKWWDVIVSPVLEPDKKTISRIISVSRDVTEQKLAIIKIEESEKKFRLLTDAMPQKVNYADANGNFHFFNQKWIDDTGLTFEELEDGGWGKFVHPEDLEQTIGNWNHSVSTGDAFDIECRIKNKEGGHRWHLSRAVPIRNENDKILMWVGSNTDIHEQIEQQEALEKAVKERTKELELTNNLLTLQNEEKEKRSAELIIANIELAFQSSEKEKRAAELAIANQELVFQNEEKEKAQITLKNTNLELTAAHELLIKFNSELEKTVKERTQELGKSNMDLRRINSDMDNFIYTASHDLKAPINNIEGLVGHLIKKIPNDSTESLKIIEMINNSIARFKNTLIDLSEIAKIQSDDETDLEILNFKELASFVKEDINILIEEAKATIIEDYSKATEIKFSKKNLRSVLYNLISNAVKYRSAERKPVVEITTYTQDDEFMVLSVKDNGLGIKEDDKEKVFTMFKRLHNHVEGTGVGMSIVKRIIDNADGKIEVESKLNEGTTFKVYFKRK